MASPPTIRLRVYLLVERQLYFDGLLDSQSLAKIDLRVLVAPHFKLDRPLDATRREKW